MAITTNFLVVRTVFPGNIHKIPSQGYLYFGNLENMFLELILFFDTAIIHLFNPIRFNNAIYNKQTGEYRERVHLAF